MSECHPGDFGEKEFYLEEFRGRTLAILVTGDSLRLGTNDLTGIIAELVANTTRIILFLGALGQAQLERLTGSLQGGSAAVPGFSHPFSGEDISPAAGPGLTVRRIWAALRESPLVVISVAGPDSGGLVKMVSAISSRLRLHKLVIVDPGGGLKDRAGNAVSFIDVRGVRDILERGELGGAGLRRHVLEAASVAVREGVGSVSVCSLEGLAGELFSYQGTGTLCTLEDYCRVSRVGIDDFREVERFIRRGQEEGFLKPRSEAEIAALLPDTWGATVGSHRLAGVCALEQYRREGIAAGEVVALCTVSRFKGGGVGSRLLSALLDEAREQALTYVFACTGNPRAVQFFLHQGFRIVAASEVPPEKWRGYDPDRRVRVTPLRLDL